MKNNILKLKSGFTLIETLVAISILTAAIAGPLVMSIKNIGTANTSQDQLVAFYLGQEVIEYVRNVRDTNLLEKSFSDTEVDWLKGLDDCIPDEDEENKFCKIDVFNTNNNVTACEVDECGYLTTTESNDVKKYRYLVGENSPFIRKIQITRIGLDEAQVDVTMTWKSKYGKNKTKTMNLQDHIFNWRE